MYKRIYRSKFSIHAGITVISGILSGCSDYHKENRYYGLKRGLYVGFIWPIIVPLQIDQCLNGISVEYGKSARGVE